MTKKKTTKKVSAVDAIKQPFQFESKSTQTHSPSKVIHLGGTTKTVSVMGSKGRYESQTRVEGGEDISVSYRIRTGKTKRERLAKVREVPKEAAPTKATSKKKK